MQRFTLALCMSLDLLVCGNAFGQDASQHEVGQGLEEKIKAVLRAEQPEEATARYHELFNAAGVDGLRELKLSPHDSIAIQAAWQEVALTVPETKDENKPTFRPDQGKLNWFLGFLEGRTRLRIPKWWREAVLDARANRRDNFYFPYLRFGELISKEAVQTAVTKRGERFSLTVGKDSMDLPSELLKDVVQDGKLSSRYAYSAYFGPQKCYIAIYDDAGYPYSLVCVNRTSTKVVWKTKGWGSFWGMLGGKVGRARVAVDVQGDRVLVFGCSGLGFVHAEAFRADNGKNIFRFSNTYSEYRD
jgi:hypothetical protein